MQTKLNHTFPITLTTLTPLAIGNETANTSFAVYHYDNGYFYYLDFNKIENLDSYNKENLNEYVQKILEETRNNKVDFAKEFEKIFGTSIINLSTKIVKGFGLVGGETLELAEIIKANNLPFVSGSTLKGAIKGELMCDYLVQNKDTQIVKDFVKGVLFRHKIEKVEDKVHQDWINILEHFVFGTVWTQKDKDKNLKIYKFNSTQTEKRQFFSMFRITDSSSVDCWEVSLMERLRFTDGKRIIPYLTEHIGINKTVNFDIQIDCKTYFKDILPVDYLRKDNGIKKLFKKINQNTRYFLEHEIEILNSIEGLHAMNYQSHCRHLLDELAELSDAETIMRIGSGKSFFQNSLAMAIQQIDKVAYEKYLEIYCKKKVENSYESPYTRALTYNDVPLGWVKLTLDEANIYKPNLISQRTKINELFA